MHAQTAAATRPFSSALRGRRVEPVNTARMRISATIGTSRVFRPWAAM